MNSKLKEEQEGKETFPFEDTNENVKINYSDFLKDTEEIEAQIKKEEEEKKAKIKEKIKRFESVRIKEKKDNSNKNDVAFDSIDFDTDEIKNAEKVKKIAVITSSVTAALIVLYLIIAFGYFSNRFLPSTIINDVDCSNKTVDEISSIMAEKVNDYHLSILYNDITVDELYGSDINMEFGDMDKVLQDICDHQKKVSWLKGVFCNSEPISTGKGLKYDTSVLNQFINSSLVLGITSTTKSVDAYIKFNEGKYEIVPAVYGDEINKNAVVNKIISAVNSLDNSLDINRDDCFIKPVLTEYNDNLINSCNLANKLINNKIELNAADDLFEIPVDIKKDWFDVNSEGSLIFDEDAFAKYMDKVDKSYSANTEVREFKTFYGDTVKVTGGDFGTSLNRKKMQADMQEAMFKEGNTKVVAEFYVTQNEIGNSYIEVDLSNQMLWMFIDGEQKLCAPIITGRDDETHATPEGIYRLKSKSIGGTVKEKDESKTVKYWMSINGENGICDADWKNLFGGEVYKTEGSDGSIYVLEDAAKTIYENSYENMPIVCYHHAIVEDFFIEDSYMNELMNLIANKPEIPEYKGDNETEETSEDVTDETGNEEEQSESVSQESSDAADNNDTSLQNDTNLQSDENGESVENTEENDEPINESTDNEE